MSFLKLVVSFAPWIAFLVIARDTSQRVEIGLAVSLGLSVLMAVLRLHRGIIMWVGLVFFTGATVAVVGFHDMWTVKYLGVLANGALALGSWVTLLIGKPFTLEYAKQHADRAQWRTPLFIRTNVILTGVWATVFTVNTVVAWILIGQVSIPAWAWHTMTYVALLAAAAFTSWYPTHVRRTAHLA
ncbi:hypothetical protein BH09ACT7_BH09ACT7_38810 [soil metagenome]